MWTVVLAAVAANAAELEHRLVWDLTVKGAPVGERTAVIRYLEGSAGTNRILETYTDVNGAVGPMKVRYRQRMTASIDAREPAAFHAANDQGGATLEVQGRWTPSGWVVTSTASGRSRTVDMPVGRIDLSTADLMDPYTRVPLSYYTEARILSAESGEVLVGPVEKLGVSEVTIKGEPVQVSGYAWTSPQGRSEFYYSADGFLVRYKTQLLGIELEALLKEPPPGGVDDFPVAVGHPKVEILDL